MQRNESLWDGLVVAAQKKNKQIKNSSNLKENDTKLYKIKSSISCTSLHPSITQGHLESRDFHPELEDSENFGLPDQ